MKNSIELKVKVCCDSCQHKPAGSFMTMCPRQRNPSENPADEYCDSWTPNALCVRQTITADEDAKEGVAKRVCPNKNYSRGFL